MRGRGAAHEQQRRPPGERRPAQAAQQHRNHRIEPVGRHRPEQQRIQNAYDDARPDRSQVWSYIFFVDLEGHAEDDALRTAFDKMRPLTSGFRILGSYPVEAES